MRVPDLPIRFLPIYKECLWGGNLHRTRLQAEVPESARIGESWEITDRPEENSVVAAGPWAGQTLRNLIEVYPEAILGPGGRPDQRFPLLIKFLGSSEKLSLQVHPGDAYVKRHHPWESGKAEMCYILAAGPRAEMLAGFKTPQTLEQIRAAIRDRRFETLVNHAAVRPGDAFFLPAGRVHGIGADILLAEIQQNSDLTFRVYDYGRRDPQGRERTLHVDQALDVMDLHDTSEGRVGLTVDSGAEADTRCLVTDSHFNAEHQFIRRSVEGPLHSGFQILIVTEGAGGLLHSEGRENLHPGVVLLLPAGVKPWKLEPAPEGLGLLRAWVGPRF